MRGSLSHLLHKLRARRALRTLARVAWLSLAALAAGLAGHFLWGWAPWSGAPVAAALLLAGIVLALVPRGSTYRLARRVDARLRLRDRVTTALEVADGHVPLTRVGSLLLDDGRQTIEYLTRRVGSRPAVLGRDLAAFGTLLLLLAGLALLLPLEGFAAVPGDSPLPPRGGEPSPSAVDQNDPVLGAPPETPGQSALEALADALRDQAAGRAVASALDQGDREGAADALRELADQVGELSGEGRQGLAEALREAASEARRSDPGLAGALDRAADALESGSDSAAAQALQDLAREIDGQDPGESAAQAPQGSAAEGQQGAEGEQTAEALPQELPADARGNGQGSARLGEGGEPLELESRPGEDTAPVPRGQTPLELPTTPDDTTDGSFTPARGTRDIWEAGADWLRYPWERRHVVASYFSRPR